MCIFFIFPRDLAYRELRAQNIAIQFLSLGSASFLVGLKVRVNSLLTI